MMLRLNQMGPFGVAVVAIVALSLAAMTNGCGSKTSAGASPITPAQNQPGTQPASETPPAPAAGRSGVLIWRGLWCGRPACSGQPGRLHHKLGHHPGRSAWDGKRQSQIVADCRAARGIIPS